MFQVDAEVGGETGICWLYGQAGVKLPNQSSERGEEYGQY